MIIRSTIVLYGKWKLDISIWNMQNKRKKLQNRELELESEIFYLEKTIEDLGVTNPEKEML